MARFQQSIDINVPVRIAYDQLTQFEDYPRFMEAVDDVRQLDDTHLHWSSTMADHHIEWDTEITEQQPDRCIAWRTVGDPRSAGKVELQPIGQDQARVTLTMEFEPQAMPASEGGAEIGIGERLGQDLERFKSFIESRGSATGAWRGNVHEGRAMRGTGDTAGRETGGDTIGKAIGQTADEKRDAGRSAAPAAPAQRTGAAGYAAGSEGGDLTDAAVQPQGAAQEPAAPRHQEQASLPFGAQQDQTTRSESLLSQSADDADGRFSVAAEQNFDQQSDQARQVGHMPEGAAGAVAASMGKGAAGPNDKAKLDKSIERAVPPSEEAPPQPSGRPGGRRDS